MRRRRRKLILASGFVGLVRSVFRLQEGDETSIFYSAQALQMVQKAFGVIPRIVGKGDAAKVRIVAHFCVAAEHRLLMCWPFSRFRNP